MKHNRKIFIIIAVLAYGALAPFSMWGDAKAFPVGTGRPSGVSIEKVEWTIETLPGPPIALDVEFAVYASFTIYLKGVTDPVSAIEDISILDAAGVGWHFDPALEWDKASRSIGGGFRKSSIIDDSRGNTALRLGEYTVTLKLKNGEEMSGTFVLTGPESSNPKSMGILYTSSYRDIVTPFH